MVVQASRETAALFFGVQPGEGVEHSWRKGEATSEPWDLGPRFSRFIHDPAGANEPGLHDEQAPELAADVFGGFRRVLWLRRGGGGRYLCHSFLIGEFG